MDDLITQTAKKIYLLNIDLNNAVNNNLPIEQIGNIKNEIKIEQDFLIQLRSNLYKLYTMMLI